MRRYIARQLVQFLVVILGISILAFAILHVLGDPVLLLLPQNAGKEEFERYRHLLGLDRPLYVQYWKFLSNAGSVANAIVGGWQFQNIISYRSGVPYTPTISPDLAHIGGGGPGRPGRRTPRPGSR